MPEVLGSIPSISSGGRRAETVVLVLRRLRQEDGEFKANLGYSVKLCLKSHTHPIATRYAALSRGDTKNLL